MRKVRVGDTRRGKGKRGGIRVIYPHVPEANVVYLMDIYGKDEQQDLSAVEKRFLKSLALRYNQEAIQHAQKERP
ncbi:hypothetical protein [Aquisphaera giovannonii]|uniref:hypothetical protein n=1 Tax=Aquisphaera giovannonii TaxID=406548 RepID=UPI001AEFA0A8|nr:hypothetical protein [Aquisphaera giovannonii]